LNWRQQRKRRKNVEHRTLNVERGKRANAAALLLALAVGFVSRYLATRDDSDLEQPLAPRHSVVIEMLDMVVAEGR
jgi:hypothetical protein